MRRDWDNKPGPSRREN